MFIADKQGFVVDLHTGETFEISVSEPAPVYTTEMIFSWRGSSETVESLNPRDEMPSNGWAYVPWE